MSTGHFGGLQYNNSHDGNPHQKISEMWVLFFSWNLEHQVCKDGGNQTKMLTLLQLILFLGILFLRCLMVMVEVKLPNIVTDTSLKCYKKMKTLRKRTTKKHSKQFLSRLINNSSLLQERKLLKKLEEKKHNQVVSKVRIMHSKQVVQQTWY